MRISSKARYGLASMIHIGTHSSNGECVTIVSIAERLGISKIYLEQVFSLLKRAELVTSIKGAQGGYQLANTPDQITAGHILRAIETSLFEKTERTVSDSANGIEKTLEDAVWNPLDEVIVTALDSIALSELMQEAEKHTEGYEYMFYI